MRPIFAWMLAGSLVLVGCSGGMTPTAEEAVPEQEAAGAPVSTDRAEPGRPVALEETVLPAGVRMIREAHLDLEVPEGAFSERWAALRRVAVDLGGHLAQASVTTEERGPDRAAVGTATLRIPADRLDEAIERLEGLGERVSLDLSSRDVSEEHVDLEARLRHWRAVEAFHLRLLEQAETVTEALEVQNRLQEVQLSIERIEGRLRHLEDRVALATVTVSMREAGAAVSATFPPEELAEAWSRAGQVALAVIGFLIVAAAGLTPLVLVGGGGYLLWRVGRRVVPRGT